MEEKPELRRYLKAQNDPYYKITGIIRGDNGERTYYETNYARNKCIIDTVILFIVIAFFTILFTLGILQNKNANLFHEDAPGLILTLLILPFWHIIMPFIASLLRTFLGLRLYFTQFTEIIPEKNDNYLEFYNSFIADELGYASKKARESAKVIKAEYYKDDPNAKRKILNAVNIVFSLSYWIYALAFVSIFSLNLISIGFAVIMFCAGLMLIYGLSHAAAHLLWNHGGLGLRPGYYD